MSHPYAPTADQGGASDRVAPVVDLRTGRPVEGRPSPHPRPAPEGEGEPAPAGEVLSGEVLPALERAAAQPVLPDWLTDRRVAVQRLRWVARAGARVTVRYVVWSPVIAARCVPPVARGTARGARAWYRWVTAARMQAEAAELRSEDRGLWRAAVERAQRARRARAWVTLAALPSAAGTVALAGAAWGPGVWWATAAGLAAAAGLAGRRDGERILGVPGAAPDRPVMLGMPAGQLHATIGEVMRRLRLDVTVLRSQAHPWGWDVQVMAGQAVSRIADRAEEIEARLRTRQGAITVISDAQDAGMCTLRIVWVDPYASMPPPPARQPGSVSVRDLASIGRTLDGGELRIPLLAHTGIIGKTGSGKSSALWTMLDAVTAASDVVVMGIDLSDGPALNVWGDTITHYATTPTAAEGQLKAALAIAHARAAVMGRRLRPTADSDPGEDVDETWRPTPDAPALILVIDEYPLVAAHPELRELVEEYLRVARKAAGYAYIASQRAGRHEMGTTTVKAMMTSKILLACEAGDVEMLMGPGKRAEGWRPDRLQPATPGQPNDAGRCYVSAPGHSEPRLSAVYRLDAREARRRAIERLRHIREHGRPQIDRPTWEQADLYARRRWLLGLDELLTQSGATRAGETTTSTPAQEPREVPRILADLRAVMAGRDAVHTRTILPALAELDDRYAGWSGADLADAVRRYGLTSAQLRNVAGVANANGYKLSDIETAIARATDA